MHFVGDFFIKGELNQAAGEYIAMDLLIKAKSDEIPVNDGVFKQFLCCIFEDGNFEFLRTIAEKLCKDENKPIIIEFIDMVEVMTKEGHKELHGE